MRHQEVWRLQAGKDRANLSTGEHDRQPRGGRGADEEKIERERLRQDDTIQKAERAEGDVLGRGTDMLLLGERCEVQRDLSGAKFSGMATAVKDKVDPMSSTIFEPVFSAGASSHPDETLDT